MNRLKYARMYCCGPMDDDREGGKIWRQEISKFCENLGIICLNPYNKQLHSSHGEAAQEDDINFKITKEAIEKEDYEEVSKRIKFVRASDLRMVDHADFLVARLDFSKIMSGTIEEIVTANREKKPVIIYSSVAKKDIPLWYFGMLPHELFFTSMEQVKEYIHHIHEDSNIDTLNRWIFFNLEEKISKIK